jgi:hypothetical protein
MPQIPGGVTDKHWSMIENLRQTCRRFLVVWLTSIDLWSKICGTNAADSWWCDWQTLIYDRKSAANVPQIPGGVTDRRRTTDGQCNPALLRPQMGYIISVHFVQFTWYQTDILTPTLGTGQNHTYNNHPYTGLRCVKVNICAFRSIHLVPDRHPYPNPRYRTESHI